jgi:hypothetical protein
VRSRIALAVVIAAGCSTTATIDRSPENGGSLEGYVVGGNPDNVLVTGPGGLVSIPRSHITHVDHPGNVQTVVGAALSLVGLVGLTTGFLQCDPGPNAFCIGPAGDGLILTAGLGLITWGAMVWGRSVSAERPPVVPSGGAPLGPRPPPSP